MKLTLKNLASAISTGAIGRLISDAHLPISVKFRIKNIWKQLKPQFEEYEEHRTELCKKFGKLTPKKNDPDESYYAFDTPELEAEFNTKLKELQAEEIEIIGKPLKPSDLKRKLDAPDPLSSFDLLELDWLIVEDEEPETPVEGSSNE